MVKKFRIEKHQQVNDNNIIIDGDADEYSIVQAIKLNIDGDTKPTSLQFARRATIHQHSGSLRCNEAYIHILKDGIINATKVYIGSCEGGEIYAQDIEIENLNKNSKIFFSNSLKITNLNSTNTTITINYKQIPILVSKLELLNEDIKNFKTKLEDAKKHNIPSISFLEKNIKQFEQEQNLIINSTKTAHINIQNSTENTNSVLFVNKDFTKTITIKKGNNITISI